MSDQFEWLAFGFRRSFYAHSILLSLICLQTDKSLALLFGSASILMDDGYYKIFTRSGQSNSIDLMPTDCLKLRKISLHSSIDFVRFGFWASLNFQLK